MITSTVLIVWIAFIFGMIIGGGIAIYVWENREVEDGD